MTFDMVAMNKAQMAAHEQAAANPAVSTAGMNWEVFGIQMGFMALSMEIGNIQAQGKLGPVSGPLVQQLNAIGSQLVSALLQGQ